MSPDRNWKLIFQSRGSYKDSDLPPMLMTVSLVTLSCVLSAWTVWLLNTSANWFVEFGAPTGAIAGGIAGTRRTLHNRRRAGSLWTKIGWATLAVIAGLSVLLAALIFLMSVALCGAYWWNSSC